MELGRDYQVPERASGAAVGVYLLVVVGTGLVLAAAAAPLLGPDAVHAYWWLLAVLPVVLLAGTPPVTNRLLGAGLRLASAAAATRSPVDPGPAARRRLGPGLLAGLRAARLGAGRPALPAAGLPLLARATGAFTAAWCAGFLLVAAPAGAGVREGALVLLLGGALTRPQASVVAVVSRLLFVLGDLGWAGVAVLAGRRAR